MERQREGWERERKEGTKAGKEDEKVNIKQA